MEVSVQFLGNSRFSAGARGHEVVTDQSFENGGADSAMSPQELLLASIGTSVAHYAAQYLCARGLPIDGLHLSVQAEKGSQPARFANISVNLSVHEMEAHHREGLLRAMKACLVHQTLQHQPHVNFLVTAESSDEPPLDRS